MSKRHHNGDKKKNQKKIPEIFRELWDLNFVKWEENFIKNIEVSKIEKGVWPKIKIAIAYTDEKRTGMIKALLQKYEVPFSNVSIEPVPSGEKKESETKPGGAGSGLSLMARMNKPGGKENGRPNTGKNIGGRKLPPFHCI